MKSIKKIRVIGKPCKTSIFISFELFISSFSQTAARWFLRNNAPHLMIEKGMFCSHSYLISLISMTLSKALLILNDNAINIF